MLKKFWLKYFAGCWKMIYKNEIENKSIWMQNYLAAKAAVISANLKVR